MTTVNVGDNSERLLSDVDPPSYEREGGYYIRSFGVHRRFEFFVNEKGNEYCEWLSTVPCKFIICAMASTGILHGYIHMTRPRPVQSLHARYPGIRFRPVVRPGSDYVRIIKSYGPNSIRCLRGHEPLDRDEVARRAVDGRKRARRELFEDGGDVDRQESKRSEEDSEVVVINDV